MKFFHLLIIGLMSLSLSSTAREGSKEVDTVFKAGKARQLTMADGKFWIDGKETQFICGEIHYPRIPRELWRDRLRKARAMGVNCVSAYVFWAFHERVPGKFDFSGNADIAEFIRLAHEEDLMVYLRPGPYVCAEYDFGGYPYWLLNEKDMIYRSNDPKFLKYMQRYIDALAKELEHMTLAKGGPIAIVQVENEYGSYSNDKVYLNNIRKMILDTGFGDTLLTTCDGWGQMPNGYLEGCLPTINGATGMGICSGIDRFQKGGPYFVSEFYPAWFDEWGRRHSRKDKDHAARQFDWMLKKDVSVSIYMFHGGTNFWYTNGANAPKYKPQPTSYDYDAPLGEYGNMTPKYFAFREVAERYLKNGEKLPPVPPQPKVVTIDEFELTQSAPLSVAFEKPVFSKRPMTMEALKQDYGYILYRSTIKKNLKGNLVCKDLRDFAFIRVDGKEVGQMDRRYDQDTIRVDIKAGSVLEILVENVGRVNYGKELLNNFKGITKSVHIGDEEILDWQQFRLPLHRRDVFAYDYGEKLSGVQAFHRGSFTADEIGEVFLDLQKWGKGSVWVNGKSLGKFWSVGPQQTMYLPSCWLKKGKNDIVILELDDRGTRQVSGLKEPILDLLQEDKNRPSAKTREGSYPQLDKGDVVAATTFKAGDKTQTIMFSEAKSARHIALEILSSYGDQPHSHLAEIDILDANGKPYSKKDWKIWFANSEELSAEDGKAENLIDGKSKTFWHSVWSHIPTKFPHVIVIDTGSIETVGGIRYTGREGNKGGAKELKVYARPQFFLNK